MIITLLTDFGTADYFVAALKGVLLTRNPAATLVDITHEVPPHNIAAGAFTLLACARDFPAGTIHLAVVDPGVGSARRPLVVESGGQLFVGPDNGLFSHFYDGDPAARIFHLTNESCFLPGRSTTFHGRDIFAPAAAALSNGARPEELGVMISDPVRQPSLACVQQAPGLWSGAVQHIDRFGNVITNFRRSEILAAPGGAGMRIEMNGRVIERLVEHYAEAAAGGDALFAIWGSAGFLEISAWCASAAVRLNAQCGDEVVVRLR